MPFSTALLTLGPAGCAYKRFWHSLWLTANLINTVLQPRILAITCLIYVKMEYGPSKKIHIRVINCIKDEWILSPVSHFISEEPEVECSLVKINFWI